MWSDEVVAGLKQTIKEKLDLSYSVTDQQMMEMIEQEVFSLPYDGYLTAGQKHTLI
jgi:pilus assembly protein CpaF